jgi:hypothetical protein
MIVIKLIGGLGNQIFHYAMVYQLKKIYPDFEIYYDTSYFKEHKTIVFKSGSYLMDQYISHPLREYMLDVPIKPNFISRLYRFLSKKHLFGKKGSWLDRISYAFAIKHGNIKKEKFELGYIKNFYKSFSGAYTPKAGYWVEGNWCDHRYFEGILDELKQDFRLLDRSVAFHTLSDAIGDQDIMMHVRRGDYLNMGQGPEGLFIGMNYYRNALNLLIANGIDLQNAVIWVFSNDYEWCEQNFIKEFPNLKFCFGSQSLSDVESFELMRQFKYRILANSTYSLWSYFLSDKTAERTIYPKVWEEGYRNIGFQILNLKANGLEGCDS